MRRLVNEGLTDFKLVLGSPRAVVSGDWTFWGELDKRTQELIALREAKPTDGLVRRLIV
jgi:hypothetical protein